MEQQTYTYKTVGNCHIRADVFSIPDGRARPAVVWIHGGALITGSRKKIKPKEARCYVDAGYTVISIDYRLAPETKLHFIMEDVQDAFRWVYAEGPDLFQIDPARIAAVGKSAGGYLALMAGVRVHPKPAALVSVYGYGDIAGAWYAEPDDFYNRSPQVSFEEAYECIGNEDISESAARGKFYLYCRQKGLWPIKVTGFDPKTEPQAFDALCPVRNVSPGYPPTLLIHGDADTDVPFGQSVLMADALARAGVAHEFVRYPGAGHGLTDETNEDATAKTIAFLQRFV